jgi:DNA modification methylase
MGALYFRDVCGKCGATRTDQQLGLEATPDLFVARMVDVFREIRRVLRTDGTCWVNLGDSYNNRSVGRKSSHQGGLGFESEDLSKSWAELTQEGRTRLSINDGVMKEKDLCGIPWRVAFALQADGWYLRSDIVWAKPNPMPESVTDRPTKSHEYVFLLTKGPRYFFDQEAVREPAPFNTNRHMASGRLIQKNNHDAPKELVAAGGEPSTTRNIRSVWEIATQPYPEAHFATFPEALPERCIKAGTSERGCCPECGAGWVRVLEKVATGKVRQRATGGLGTEIRRESHGLAPVDGTFQEGVSYTTKGWRPKCACGEPAFVPCTVLDPFMGSGTTALVARKLGRRSIGIELNPDYAALCARRLQQLSLFAGEIA